uniref:Uncharacterized protein n=1 Tax=Setaria viridis TaxID=4556 RepID=A0A4U6T4V5_SETVI|nr:hypothetical protein SEVIR_9G408800v2 [Setaria viridis]
MPSCERSCGVGGDGAGRRPRRSSSVCPPDSPRKEEWPAAGSRKHLRSTPKLQKWNSWIYLKNLRSLRRLLS